MNLKSTLIYFLISILISGQYLIAQNSEKVDLSTAREIDHSIKEGLKWLYAQQEDDGSWQHYPAISALVLSSYLRAHPSISINEPVIENGFEFLKSCVKPDGSIFLDDMPNYNTAICLTAFKDANFAGFDEIIKNAEDYLIGLQIDESDDFTTDSIFYGGVGYGGDERPDLSNLQWAIESMALDDMKATDAEKQLSDEEKERMHQKKLFYDKALVFLAKCQNLQSVNPEEYSQNDGGFMYEPGKSKAGGTDSYGSMTYAGLKSMIYAKLEKDDERVIAAYNWIRSNYTVETTPGMGDQGLFYYYQTMAKSLNLFGEEEIQDLDGNSHDWRYDLANQLLKIQTPEGFWMNENGRWWENNPVLVTAYAILALEEIAGLPESTTNKKRKMIFKSK
ncbi:MAG: terpene cyclase/mutase family protein [Bacteroidales bacterium]|nr:terpene cyclase/mutase family protein [Bacteroidales bacterium]